MLLLTHDDIVKMDISQAECYMWVEDAIKLKGSADIIMPPKASLKPYEGCFMNVMPCVLGGGRVGGVKVVSRIPERVPSLDSQILLYDLRTGENLALLDGNFITAMRTGAVAAHSIKLLAKEDFHTISIMGMGNVTYSMFLTLLSLFPDRKMTVKLLTYKDQHKRFAARFSAHKNLTFEYITDVNDWARGSDVIVSGATYLAGDICQDAAFEEGVLLVPIHTRGFSNCDLFFDKVFGDDYAHIKGFKYFDRFRSFAEISDVVNGKKPGRTSPTERIIAYNIGIAIHDIYYAHKIYERAVNCSAGKEIQLAAPAEKEWV